MIEPQRLRGYRIMTEFSISTDIHDPALVQIGRRNSSATAGIRYRRFLPRHLKCNSNKELRTMKFVRIIGVGKEQNLVIAQVLHQSAL